MSFLKFFVHHDVLTIVVAVLTFLVLKCFKNVGATQIAIYERRFLGAKMPAGRVVAGKGEVGIQADVLKPGLKFIIWPLERIVQTVDLIEIGPDEIGIVEAIDGQPMPQGRNFAPDVAENKHQNFQDPIAFLTGLGLKGMQMRLLPPGKWPIHPYLFQVFKAPVTVIPDGKLGIVTATDGAELQQGRVVASKIEGHNNFQNPEAFIKEGGQKGPQVEYLTPGRYRIMVGSTSSKGASKPGLFSVELVEQTLVPEDRVAIIEALDGQEIPTSDYVAPKVDGHNNFTDGNGFLKNGGHKGVQLDILKPGKYFINPKLFRVTSDNAVVVNPGEVGVIVSNFGADPTHDVLRQTADEAEQKVEALTKEHVEEEADATAAGAPAPTILPARDHADSRLDSGNREVYVVPAGYRGIQKKVLGPGKYYLNSKAYTVVIVPTTNQTVEWNNEKANGFDPFQVISQDGFIMAVEVRVVVRITPDNAPFMVSKIGTIENLRNNVLQPTTDAIFRNQASGSSAMNYLRERQKEQSNAEAAVRRELERYHVDVANVLITNLNLPEDLIKTQQNRIIAEQQEGMYTAQRASQLKRIELSETTAQADQQPALVTARIGVQIAEQQAEQRKRQAEGEAEYIRQTGSAEAEITQKKGEASGAAYQAQQAALGQAGVTLVEALKLIASGNVKITPDNLVTSGGNGNGSSDNTLGGWITLLLSKQLSTAPATAPATALQAATDVSTKG